MGILQIISTIVTRANERKDRQVEKEESRDELLDYVVRNDSEKDEAETYLPYILGGAAFLVAAIFIIKK